MTRRLNPDEGGAGRDRPVRAGGCFPPEAILSARSQGALATAAEDVAEILRRRGLLVAVEAIRGSPARAAPPASGFSPAVDVRLVPSREGGADASASTCSTTARFSLTARADPAALAAKIARWLNEVWGRWPLVAGILTGGRSQRMGAPKHALRLGGITLFDRVRRAVAPWADEIVRLGRALPDPDPSLAVIDDPAGVRGPLAGLLAAVRARPDASWIVAACDQPLIDAGAIGWLLSQRAPGRRAVLARREDGAVEPLPIVIEPTARPLIEQLAGGSARAGPSALARSAGVACRAIPHQHARAFDDVDTPAALAALERRLGRST